MKFYFRISAEAEMAQDEDGNPTECYAKMEFSSQNNQPKDPLNDYETVHKGMATALAKQTGFDTEWVIPISEEEYDAQIVGETNENVTA